VALLTLTNAALGQERVTIAGAVVDSLGRPVPDVSVMVDGTDVRMVTGTDGGFRLVVAQPDNVTLVVSRTGWVTRRLGVKFAGGEQGTRDVGSIAFYPVPGRFAVIRGRLWEEGSGEPLAAVIVSLNGQALAMSDEAGEFSLTARVQSGRNALEFRRIGYEDTRYLFELRPGETEVDVEQSLAAAAVRLSDLEVREEAMARHLATFIRHRDQGLGYFWDAEEIEELEPVVVSDVVRRVPGARVITGETPVAWTDADFLAGRPPTGVETTINFHRLGNPERHVSRCTSSMGSRSLLRTSTESRGPIVLPGSRCIRPQRRFLLNTIGEDRPAVSSRCGRKTGALWTSAPRCGSGFSLEAICGAAYSGAVVWG
jgi:hypothetical protein